MKLSLPRILLCCLIFFPSACRLLHVDTPPPSSEKGTYQIHFNNIAMTEYLRFIAKISNSNFTFDQADLQFSVTIVSEEPTTVENIFLTLAQVLRINNLTLLKQDDNYVISKSDQVSQIPEMVSSDGLEGSGTEASLATHVFRIRNANVNSVATIIRSMVSQKALISVSTETDQLIITDTTTNVNKIATLISLIESPDNPLKIVATNASTGEFVALAEQPATPFSEETLPVFAPQVDLKGVAAASKEDPKLTSPPDEGSRYSFAVPKRIVLSHTGTNGNGMGYATNYTTLGIFFAPVYETDRFLPMVDIRGHRFDNDTYAGNIGLLTRYIQESAPRIFGLNLYYDYRQGNQGTYNQFSAGIEILGKRWDFRANGYVPVGNKTFTSCCVYDDYIGDYVAIQRDNEFVSFGYNAEVGYLITRSTNYLLYAAAGPYYLSGKFNSQVRGGEIRLRPQFKDYIAVDLRLSHDSVFNTVFQVEVIVSLPLYEVTLPKNKKGANGLVNRQIYQPVERFEVVPIGKRCCWDANW